MSYQRVLHLTSGVALVVTDLHGAGAAYERIRDDFLRHYQAGQVQRLIFCGDLIHGYGSAADDASLPMLLDVMRLQRELGRETVILLLGNHEMPHIYGIHLSKGDVDFTPRFEAALTALDVQPIHGQRRADVLAFLRSLPLYVSTQAGVLLTHAGAPPQVQTVQHCAEVFDFDHDALLRLYDDRLRRQYDLAALKTNRVYLQLAQARLAIQDAADIRLPELLRAELISQTSAELQQLWDVLFALNEQGSSIAQYSRVVQRFLEIVSALTPVAQRVLVAGHIGVRGGHALIGTQQLRLASYAHAHPPQAGQVLWLDCDQPVQTAGDLLPGLRPVFARG